MQSSLRLSWAWVCGCVLLAPLGLRAELSAPERDIAVWIASKQDEMVELLERAVKIDSPTENHAGVRAMSDLFTEEVKPLGFDARWIALPEETKRAGHFFAERRGSKGKRLLLIGHLDTVLPGGKFEREGERARGSGTADMKGGDVVLVYALKALHALGALEGVQIAVIMTGDEESVGEPVEVCRRDLLDTAKRSDIALAFEAGSRTQGTVARRGATSWTLEITAATGHSSGVFSAAMGSGAIYEAARILEGFHTELPKLPGLTANAAIIAGGADVKEQPLSLTAEGKNNIIPATVIARGDLRAVSPEQLTQAEAVMRAVVAKHRPRTEPKLTISHRYPPMDATKANLDVLAQFDAVSRDLGYGAVVANDAAQRGAGDSAFAARHCAVLDGLGPSGIGSHAERESVDLKSFAMQTTRAAVLIYRLTR
jgi:glutamate carboxypeptidase